MLIALYARVSTVRQAENDLSIPDQLRQMQDWAKQNGHIVVAKYVEPGASATDDKRPIFQKMMSDALAKPPMFEAIIVHSHSRFFRDGIEAGVRERMLKRNGVKLFSITQPTTEDSNGELVRNIIRMFDGYQSQETSKHTSRAMKENARQGYFNGSRAPFGYVAVSTDVSGARGRKKKKLAIHADEANVARQIYRLYLSSLGMGFKEIAIHLTKSGLLMRGRPWNVQKVSTILSDTLYMGEYYFNVRDSRSNCNRPPEEWVKTLIPAIVDANQYEQVRKLRESRSPENATIPPKTLASPLLLAGVIKCRCGRAMTLATGKSGTYRYYKCTRKRNEGGHACDSRNLPMEKVDQIVIEQLANRILAPDRIQSMMETLRQRIQARKDVRHTRVSDLERQLKAQDERQHRLLEAIESGIVELDELTHQRMQNIKTAREALTIQIAEEKCSGELPREIEYLKPSQVEQFGRALRNQLLSKNSGIAKAYISLLVDEVLVNDDEAVIKGSYTALAHGLHQMKMGTSNQVPTFMHDWCAGRDSNS
ncbi:Recombinase [Ferriphaselus amnicola]|uniref:Recombinase n=1 Tax=Ferriphaselus amnicola TaxID=1188319 RepID=A0A2Z6GCC2_9PROT|nr:recombinase family protein [Ferriphaselus amnicola]BBE51261.1 Recombinase [Ferriphaselus amnicola]